MRKKSFLPAEKSVKATSERIKQVYFPVTDGYHLLSVLTPSGITFKLKRLKKFIINRLYKRNKIS